MEGNATKKDVSMAHAETVTAAPPVACLDRTYNRRRSSILKPAKLRNPLQELDFNPSEDIENTANVTRKVRRVSFAAGMQVKEFVEVHTETETMTLWGSSYEQIFGHSDTSHHSDGSPPEESIAVNNITNISTLVTGKINTAVTNLIKPPNDQRLNNYDGLNVSENSMNVGINESYQNMNDSNHINYNINNRRKGGVSFGDMSSVSTLENRHEILSSGCRTSSLRSASSSTPAHHEDRRNVSKSLADVSQNQLTSFGREQNNVIPASTTRLWQSRETVDVRDDNEPAALDLTTTKPVNMSTTYLESANCSYTSDYSRRYFPNTSYRKESENGCLDKTTIFDKTGFLGLMDLTETVGDNCERLADQQQSNRTAYEDNMDFTEPISDEQFRENSQLNKTGLVHNSDVSSSLCEVVNEECDPRFNTPVGTFSKTLFEGDMDFTEAIHNDSWEDQTNVFPSSGITSQSVGNKTMFDTEMDFTEPVNKVCLKPDGGNNVGLRIASQSVGNKTMFDTEMDFTEPVNKVCLKPDAGNNVHIRPTDYASRQILSRESYCVNDTDDDTMVADDEHRQCNKSVHRLEDGDGEKIFSTCNKTVFNNDDMDFTEPLSSFPPADSPLRLNDESAEDYFKTNGKTYEVDGLQLTKSFKHSETRGSECFGTFDNTGDGDNMDFTETVNTMSQQVWIGTLNQTDLGDNVKISNNAVFSEECTRKFDKTVYVGDMDLTEVVGNISEDTRKSLLSTSSTYSENMHITVTADVSQSDCIDSQIDMTLSTSNCSIQNKILEYDNVSISERTVSELGNKCAAQTQEKIGTFEKFNTMVCQNDTLSTQSVVSSNSKLAECDLDDVKVNEDDIEVTVYKYASQSLTESAQYEQLKNVHLRVSCLPASFKLRPQVETMSPVVECIPINISFPHDHCKTLTVNTEVSKSTPKHPVDCENISPETSFNSNSIVDEEAAVREEKEVEELSPYLPRLSQKRNYQANANEDTTVDELVKINLVSPPKKICYAPTDNCTSDEMKNEAVIEEGERIVQVNRMYMPLCNELNALPSIVINNQTCVTLTPADCVSDTIGLRDLSSPNVNLVEEVSCENLSSSINIPNIKGVHESYLLTESNEKLTLQIETSNDESQTCLGDSFIGPNIISSVNVNTSNQSDIIEVNVDDSLKDTSLGIIELENPEFGCIEYENMPFSPNNDSARSPSIYSTSTLLRSPATADYSTCRQLNTVNLTNENVKLTITAASTSMVEYSKQNDSVECDTCDVDSDSDSSNRTKHEEKNAALLLANNSVSESVELTDVDEGSEELRTNTLEVQEQTTIAAEKTYLQSSPADLVTFKRPLTVDEVIKSKELRPYMWRIKAMKDDEWIFTFFCKSLDLVIKLDTSNEDKCQHKVISQLYFSSCCIDESNAFGRFTHYALMQKFGTDELRNMCVTTEDVLPTLTTVSQEVQKITALMKDLHALEGSYDVKMIEHSATFDIASLKINTLFVVSIDMRDNWEVILPATINIKQIVGNVDEAEIKQLAKGVKPGPHCLRDYVRYVHEYIETLELYGGS